jgi:hypothetical protein
MTGPAKALSLVDVIKFLIVTLTKMAAAKEWGEVRITVQGGQVMFVHQNLSYKDHLPVDAQALTRVTDQRLRNLAAVG